MLNHKGSQVLETERLILRPFCAEDAEAMFRNWANDPDVTRHMSWNPHATVEVTRELLVEWAAQYQDPNYYHWAIVLKEINQPIGSLGYLRLDEFKRCGDLGFCIGKAWWGQGLVAEAAAATVDFMFDEIGLERISCSHHVDNPASGRVQQKCGFRHIGLARRYFPNGDGVLCDCELYELLCTDPRPSPHTLKKL